VRLHQSLLPGSAQSACKTQGVSARADAEAAQASLAGLQEELAGMDSSIADAKKVCFLLPPGCSRRLAGQAHGSGVGPQVLYGKFGDQINLED
jgi:hypothetical protein